MSKFFSNQIFTGPTLAVIGIFVAIADFFNWDQLANASVQLEFPWTNTLPGLVGVLATTISFAGFLCVLFRERF